MKRSIGFLSVLIATVSGLSAANAETIKVQVNDVTPGKGQIIVCLWRDKQGFPDCGKNRPVAKKMVGASASVTLAFDGLTPGEYALSAIADENGNGKLDTNFLGIPKEPLGMSNNPKFSFGAPSFAAAKFQLPGTSEITINLKQF